MNLRRIALSGMILFAAACGGEEPAEEQIPETLPAEVQTPPVVDTLPADTLAPVDTIATAAAAPGGN
jgi:hypothetical protein